MTNRKRNAVLFITGQFLSMFGSMLVQYAITWQITLETKSGIIMTLFTCAALLPMVFMMFSGLAMPLGMVVFGPLGDTMKIEWLLILTGMVILIGGLALLRSKALLEAEKP